MNRVKALIKLYRAMRLFLTLYRSTAKDCISQGGYQETDKVTRRGSITLYVVVARGTHAPKLAQIMASSGEGEFHGKWI